MLGAAGVQIPENNLDGNCMHSSRGGRWNSYNYGSPRLLGSYLSADTDLRTLDLLAGTLVLDFLGCDPLALVDSFTPLEDNIGLLETRFDVEAVFIIVFHEDVTGSVNLTLLSLFFGVTTTNFLLVLLILG
ncbi:hypothetical protein Tco_1555162 [Tanacetum coccineum]